MNALKALISNEVRTFTVLCAGVIYSMAFWSLLNNILILLLFLYWLFFLKKSFNIFSPQSRLLLLFSSLYLIYLTGLLYTTNTEEGLNKIILKIPLLVFPIIFGSINIISKNVIQTLTFHFIIAVTLMCAGGLISASIDYFASGEPLFTNQNLIIFQHHHPYLTAIFCLLCIGLLFEKRSEFSTAMTIVLVAFFSLFIILLSIRLTIGLLILQLSYYFLKFLRTPTQKVSAIAGMLAILAGIIFFVPSMNEKWRELFTSEKTVNRITLDQDSSLARNWGGTAIRLAIWECSEDIIRKNLLLGVGTGDGQDSLQQAYEERKFYFASRHNRYDAHNQYIQILVSNGVLGLIIYLSCILVPFLYRPCRQSTIYLLFISLVVAVGISESFLEINKGVVWYSFFNSLFVFGVFTSANSRNNQ
jgi:O-antigen ligase